MPVIVYDESCDFCDKCGETVPVGNDIRTLETIRHRNAIYEWQTARHFLPVVRDGVTVCPGSPSRAQFIEGQPRDTRGYPYSKEDEVAYRASWELMQRSEDERLDA